MVRVKNQDQEDEEGGRQNGSCLMCCAMDGVSGDLHDDFDQHHPELNHFDRASI